VTDGDVSIKGDQTSSTLLQRIRNTEPVAWERFVELYGPLVYHWCRQSGLQEADAADVGQDVFRAVFRAIANYRHDRPGDSFRVWLRTITRNKVKDFVRKRARVEAVGGTTANEILKGLPADPETDEPSDNTDEVAILYRRAIEMILSGFQEATRQAFLRVVLNSQDPVDVARDLGLSVNAVYLAKSRVKKRLREEFAELLDP
jgi:RNA polymerase sigma-70 factor (ECF subfamily)